MTCDDGDMISKASVGPPGRRHATSRPATLAAPLATLSSPGAPLADLRLPRRWIETVLPAELPQIAREISRRIQTEIPDYHWAADAEHVRMLRESTEKAVLTFVTQIFRTGELTAEAEEFFRSRGRIEASEGRSLEALLAAFRLGSLVAWRRLVAATERDPLPSDVVGRLGDLLFTFADRLAHLAGEGFADADNDVDAHARVRTRLARLILGQPGVAVDAVADLAARVGWTVPERVVVVELDGVLDLRTLGVLGADALVDHDQNKPIAVLRAPLDVEALTAALDRIGAGAVAGCTVALSDAPRSLRWARLAARLRDDGVLPATRLTVCDDNTPMLLLHAEPSVGDVLVARRLGPLAALPLPRRLKFARLLSAWLEHGGSQADLAQTMEAHRQTIHYRIGRLQTMFGADLDDRDARVELLLALRWALPQWEREAG
jgi:hypothetical protein